MLSEKLATVYQVMHSVNIYMCCSIPLELFYYVSSNVIANTNQQVGIN